MNVLVLAALTGATGNNEVAHRIASQLGTFHDVFVVDSISASADSLRELVRRERIDIAIGLHALLGGPFLRVLGIPYALVFGGTELYTLEHPLHERQMTRAVDAARLLIAFSPENRALAEAKWPRSRGRIHCVPQAVEVTGADESFDLRSTLGLEESAALVVLPASIRRIKDPIFAAEAFSRWHREDPRIQLAIVGAVLEPDYAGPALDLLARLPGVRFVPALPRPRMLAAMKQADVILNSAIGEGMSGVLLEAMALGKTVVARRNSGNASLIRSGETGFLFDTPEQAVRLTKTLLEYPEIACRIRRNARQKIHQHHSMLSERESYLEVVRFLGRNLHANEDHDSGAATAVYETAEVG